jgi:hypothetical protein
LIVAASGRIIGQFDPKFAFIPAVGLHFDGATPGLKEAPFFALCYIIVWVIQIVCAFYPVFIVGSPGSTANSGAMLCGVRITDGVAIRVNCARATAGTVNLVVVSPAVDVETCANEDGPSGYVTIDSQKRLGTSVLYYT